MSDNSSGGNTGAENAGNAGTENAGNAGTGNAGTENAGNAGTGNTGSANQQTVLNYMLSNKVEAGLWLTRVFTVVCTVLFFFPIIGDNPYGFYQRVFISSAATSALRLHQRLPHIQFSRQFMGMLFAEDSCHYLIFSLIFMNSYPITMALIPVFLFALLHACSYTKNLLNVMGPQSMQLIRSLIDKLTQQQINILRFIACTEIFLMPAVFFMIFVGKCSIFLPAIYYRFLTLRYASRRNPYCRTLFSELRMTIEYFIQRPQCPGFLRNALTKGIALISRLAPQVAH